MTSWREQDNRPRPVARALVALSGVLLIVGGHLTHPETTWDYVSLICLMVLVVWWAVWAIVDAVRLRRQAGG